MPAARRGAGVIIAVLSLCGTVSSMQQTLAVPLLPLLPHLLDTSPDNASWLVTATLLTGAVATPVASRLADMVGKKRVLCACMVIMIAGSVLGALTHAFVPVLVARALQGVGLALIPIGIAIMRDELPDRRVPGGVALMSATLAIGAGGGLPLTGFLVEYADWHVVFWVTGGAGLVMLAAVAVLVPESPVRSPGRFDYRGAILLSAALTALLLALSKGGQWGWTSWTTLSCLIGGTVVLLIWLPVELRVPRPLVDLRIATRPAVLLVNIAAVLTGFGMYANLLVTTQLLQLPAASGFGLGLDVVTSGLLMAPTAVVFGVMAPVSAMLTRRFGAQVTLLIGALSMAVAYVARAFLSDVLWHIVVGALLVSAGTSLAFGAMPALVMRLVPVTETASANGLNTLLRSIGTSTSSATVAAITLVGTQRLGAVVYPTLGALLSVFWLAAAASLVAAVTVLPLVLGRAGSVAPTPLPVVTDRDDMSQRRAG